MAMVISYSIITSNISINIPIELANAEQYLQSGHSRRGGFVAVKIMAITNAEIKDIAERKRRSRVTLKVTFVLSDKLFRWRCACATEARVTDVMKESTERKSMSKKSLRKALSSLIKLG